MCKYRVPRTLQMILCTFLFAFVLVMIHTFWKVTVNVSEDSGCALFAVFGTRRPEYVEEPISIFDIRFLIIKPMRQKHMI
jgi:hypothetical protein